MIALIDGDIIVYSCGFAAQKNMYSVVYSASDGTVWEVVCDGKRDAVKVCDDVDGTIKCSLERGLEITSWGTSTLLLPLALLMRFTLALWIALMEIYGW